MTQKKIVRKVHVNKNNKGLTVSLSKKQIKKLDPNIKFGKELFVSLEVFNEGRRKK